MLEFQFYQYWAIIYLYTDEYPSLLAMEIYFVLTILDLNPITFFNISSPSKHTLDGRSAILLFLNISYHIFKSVSSLISLNLF